MVEAEDLAIVFKRKMLDDGKIEYIPIKIIEGYFDYDDKWFITTNGTGYHHISDFYESGNVYAGRTPISSLINKNKKLSLNDLKGKMLSFAKEHTYIKPFEIDDKIFMINNKTGRKNVFRDIDTEIIEERYYYPQSGEELDIPISFPQITNVTSQPQKIEKKPVEIQKINNVSFTPKELADEVKKYVIGQDEAIETIATSIFLHYNFPQDSEIALKKKNILMVGPTGTGKSYIFEVISKILDIPLVKFSISGLSQAGYVGRGTDEIFQTIYNDCHGNIDKAEKSIVLLDEINKLANTSSDDGNISTKGVQKELLTIVENDTRRIKINGNESNIQLCTKNIMFVGAGAWQDLYDTKPEIHVGFNQPQSRVVEKPKINHQNIIKSGFMPELVGRFPVLVELNALELESLKKILTESKESELNAIIAALNSLGIRCLNTDEVIETIAKDAIKKHIGARGITTTIANIYTKIFYDVTSNHYTNCDLIIGPNILENPRDYTIVQNSKVKRKIEK